MSRHPKQSRDQSYSLASDGYWRADKGRIYSTLDAVVATRKKERREGVTESLGRKGEDGNKRKVDGKIQRRREGKDWKI